LGRCHGLSLEPECRVLGLVGGGEEVMGRLCRGYGRVGLVMLRSIKLYSWLGGKDCVSVAKLNK